MVNHFDVSGKELMGTWFSKLSIRMSVQFSIYLMVFVPLSATTQVWTPVNGLPSSAGLKAVHFINPLTGWVSGENGTVMKTSDGGNNWALLSTNTTQTLRGIYFFDISNGWACGDQGTVIATNDGGNSWHAQVSGTTNQLNGVEFVSATTGWIVGMNNQLLKTTNGGAGWTPQPNQGGAMWGLSMLSATNGWSAGDFNSIQGSPKLLKTTNGSTWITYYNSGINTFNTLSDIHFTDANNGWIVGTSGNIRHTADAGASTWQAQFSGTAYELLSVDFINPMVGYVCGRQGIILSTTNGGVSWAAQYSGYSSGTLWEIDMIDASTGFAAGDFGVLKYTVSAPAQPVVLLQPNGGEIFQFGTKRFIIWQVQAGISNLRLEYSIDGGNNWLLVVASTPASAGSYAWNIPNNPSVNCLVRASNAANTAINDISASAFYIMNSPTGIDYSVLTEATAANNPPKITVSWQYDLNALTYLVDRKLPAESAWTNLATLNGSTLTYEDNNVTLGIIYEYRITKSTPLVVAYGYVYSGIEIPAPDSRGTVLVAVDNTFSAYLDNELELLTADLAGDGWKVVRQDFPHSSTDVTVKNWVVSHYNLPSSDVKALLIIGHFAIPYSGNFAPDGHAERIGAQPADVFYADVDGVWTDFTVTTNNTGTIFTPNVPGDGKWDQSTIPSPAELQVGRIDMYNMTGFALSEGALLAQYLNKNHAFRHKSMNPLPKALINTHFDNSVPSTSAVAWRSFSPMIGYGNIEQMNTNGCTGNNSCSAFIDALENSSYLWAYMAGGGSDTSCGGTVFTSSQCISRNIHTVFMQLYGSYFVEWAKGGLPLPNNLLRAPLANNGMALATCWTGGGPRWYFHQMGLGETIGFSTRQSQNNTTIYDPGNNQLLGGVHMVLMGDPTLRLHMVSPVSNLTLSPVAEGLKLDWTASPDNSIMGYNIYRSDAVTGTFIRLNATPVPSVTYTDNTPNVAGNNVYMVRAVKFEVSSSGSYFNMSTGIFADQAALPAGAGPISGLSTVCQGQNSVTYTVPVIPNAVSYLWTLPAGVTGASSSNSITIDYGITAVSGNITVKGVNQAGNGIASALQITIIQIPVTYAIAGTISETECYNAVQTITVAGDGTLFLVQAGGEAFMTAGQNINFMPGTVVEPGGYMWGTIASPCSNCVSPLVLSPISVNLAMPDRHDLQFFKIYPNPTTGNFMVRSVGSFTCDNVKVEVYGLFGDMILSEVFYGKSEHEFSLSGWPAGVYCIRVMQGTNMQSMKIIKIN